MNLSGWEALMMALRANVILFPNLSHWGTIFDISAIVLTEYTSLNQHGPDITPYFGFAWSSNTPSTGLRC